MICLYGSNDRGHGDGFSAVEAIKVQVGVLMIISSHCVSKLYM